MSNHYNLFSSRELLARIPQLEDRMRIGAACKKAGARKIARIEREVARRQQKEAAV